MSAATFARCKRGESLGRKTARGVQYRKGMTSSSEHDALVELFRKSLRLAGDLRPSCAGRGRVDGGVAAKWMRASARMGFVFSSRIDGARYPGVLIAGAAWRLHGARYPGVLIAGAAWTLHGARYPGGADCGCGLDAAWSQISGGLRSARIAVPVAEAILSRDPDFGYLYCSCPTREASASTGWWVAASRVAATCSTQVV
jgi:hypothetical protein